MKIILEDLKIKVDIPTQLHSDNKSALRIAHNKSRSPNPTNDQITGEA